MSEPVIKAVGVICEDCGHAEPLRLSKCSWCQHPLTKVYTRDDLVRVAMATFEWAGFKVDPEGAEGRAAAVIVDRLTKGET